MDPGDRRAANKALSVPGLAGAPDRWRAAGGSESRAQLDDPEPNDRRDNAAWRARQRGHYRGARHRRSLVDPPSGGGGHDLHSHSPGQAGHRSGPRAGRTACQLDYRILSGGPLSGIFGLLRKLTCRHSSQLPDSYPSHSLDREQRHQRAPRSIERMTATRCSARRAPPGYRPPSWQGNAGTFPTSRSVLAQGRGPAPAFPANRRRPVGSGRIFGLGVPPDEASGGVAGYEREVIDFAGDLRLLIVVLATIPEPANMACGTKSSKASPPLDRMAATAVTRGGGWAGEMERGASGAATLDKEILAAL